MKQLLRYITSKPKTSCQFLLYNIFTSGIVHNTGSYRQYPFSNNYANYGTFEAKMVGCRLSEYVAWRKRRCKGLTFHCISTPI
jgi:hypothetical protein